MHWGNIDLLAVAKACGYKSAVSVENFTDLDRALEMTKAKDELTFIEVKCALGARDDLGRPTTTSIENKQNFMGYLNTL